MSAVSADEGDPGPGKTMATPLARVRGTGSAQAGAAHWWHERVSALAVFLLFVWFVVSLARLPALDQATIAEWLASPLAAAPMLLLVFTTFWHLQMGLIVVIEDYVHDEGGRQFWATMVKFAAILCGTLAAVSVLKIAVSGGAA